MGGGHSYIFTGWEIGYPLLARSSIAAGGAQWTTSQIGTTFLVGSAGALLYSLAVYPVVSNRFGVWKVWTVSSSVALVFIFAFPRLLATLHCASADCEGT